MFGVLLRCRCTTGALQLTCTLRPDTPHCARHTPRQSLPLSKQSALPLLVPPTISSTYHIIIQRTPWLPLLVEVGAAAGSGDETHLEGGGGVEEGSGAE